MTSLRAVCLETVAFLRWNSLSLPHANSHQWTKKKKSCCYVLSDLLTPTSVMEKSLLEGHILFPLHSLEINMNRAQSISVFL